MSEDRAPYRTANTVIWESSQTAGEVAMKKADDHLEAGRFDKALEQLAIAQRAIATTIEFVHQERYVQRTKAATT